MKLLRARDLYNDLSKYREYGGLTGVDVGFKILKHKYTYALGTCTDWTGFPTSGKTQLLLEVLLNVSEKHNLKHLLYMPDVGSTTELIADLAHKVTGKTFFKYSKNRITESELARAVDWINEHFFFLENQSDLTPLELWKFGVSQKSEIGVTSVVIDSWNYLKHDIKSYGRDDLYLAHVLHTRNIIAEKNGMHFHTVIHPTKPQKDKAGNMLPPSAYDLKGGSEWFNNGKTIIVVNRPDYNDNLVEIDIRKIKPRSLGERGKYYLHFDLETFRYYEEVNGEKYFAYQKPAEIITYDDSDDELPF